MITDQELNELFAIANSEIIAAEALGGEITVSALNELRYGSEHRVRAQNAESDEIRNSELVKAKSHFSRAAYDAIELRVLYSLEQLKKFQENFSKYAEKEDLPSYLEALETAKRLQKYLLDIAEHKELPDLNELKNKAHQLDEQLAKLSQNKNLLIKSIESSKKKTLYWAFASLTGMAATIIAALIPFVSQGPSSSDISQQINNLSDIQSSLSQLQDYVTDQKNNLQSLNQDISSLKKEKSQLEEVVSIENKKVEAVLSQYEKAQNKRRWLDIFISFLVGIFSSLTVTFIVNYRKKSKETPSVDMIVDTKGKSI